MRTHCPDSLGWTRSLLRCACKVTGTSDAFGVSSTPRSGQCASPAA